LNFIYFLSAVSLDQFYPLQAVGVGAPAITGADSAIWHPGCDNDNDLEEGKVEYEQRLEVY